MKKFLLLSLCLTPYFASSNDLVHCDGNCPPKECSEMEKFALVNIDLKARGLLTKFYEANESTNGEEFLNSTKKELSEIASDRKVFEINCLNQYCAKDENRKLTKIISSSTNLVFEARNPICDFPANNPSSPITLMSLTLKNSQGGIFDILYSARGPLVSFTQKVLTKPCTDNLGGTIRSNFVISNYGISVVPNSGTIPVTSTSTGAQLIRKKQYLPSFKIDKQQKLKFNYGDGFFSEIDLTNNTMTNENILKTPCSGMIGKNPQKNTSRYIMPLNSLNTNNLRVFDTNNYKLIEKENEKLKW